MNHNTLGKVLSTPPSKEELQQRNIAAATPELDNLATQLAKQRGALDLALSAEKDALSEEYMNELSKLLKGGE